MVNSMTGKHVNDQEEEDRDGSAGEALAGAPAFMFTSKVSEYSVLDDNQARRFAEEALFYNRIDIKAQGHRVEAFNKKQDLKQQPDLDPSQDNRQGGLNVEQHPELPPQSGLIDNVVLPDSENPESTSQNQELKNRLKHGMSMQAAKEQEHKQRYKQQLKLKEKNEIPGPRSAPPRLTPD